MQRALQPLSRPPTDRSGGIGDPISDFGAEEYNAVGDSYWGVV